MAEKQQRLFLCSFEKTKTVASKTRQIVDELLIKFKDVFQGKCIKHEQRSEKLGATCGRISHMNTCDRSSFGKRLCARHVRWEDFNCFGSPYKYFTLCNNFPCKCVRHVTRSLTSFNMLGPAVPFGWSKDKEDRQRGKEWRRGRLSGEEATLPLSDALELHLCGVNSHKTSLCSL